MEDPLGPDVGNGFSSKGRGIATAERPSGRGTFGLLLINWHRQP
jgi:hypothetical protein